LFPARDGKLRTILDDSFSKREYRCKHFVWSMVRFGLFRRHPLSNLTANHFSAIIAPRRIFSPRVAALDSTGPVLPDRVPRRVILSSRRVFSPHSLCYVNFFKEAVF